MSLSIKEYQEHEGAKDGSTLYVQYNFDTTASGSKFTKGLRPSSVRYPNGRLVHFTYGSADSTADALNRLDAIKDDSGGSPGSTLASYSYLGLGTIVIEDYEQPDVRLEYFFDSAYNGIDRFGRVIDQRWYDYGASTDRERYTYGYDRASNRLYRENTMASAKDEFYTYDAINRLATFDRGDLNAGKTAISGTPVREEDWGLDMTGNWNDYLQKTSGSTVLDQDRTHNKVNEISDITETTGTAWATPVHDRAGNMTSVPKPASLANSLSVKWDAWSRLVEAKDGATVIGVYEYDALNRRVKRHVDAEAPDNPNGIDTYIHYFYNAAWQVLETRNTATESDQPESLQPDWQYIWSLRYIDAPGLRDKNTDADGLCDDERVYYLGDANFNVTTLVDTAGVAVERYLYEAYGKETIYDGAWGSVRSESSYGNVVRYTGRECDRETGYCHYRHRYYAAGLGKFLSRDLRLYIDGVSLYQYTMSRPGVLRDPWGDCSGPHTTPADQAACCWEHYGDCKADCLADHSGPVVTPDLLDCYGRCDAFLATCGKFLTPNVPMLTCDTKECDKYKDDDEYFNTDAKCFCKCAGDSNWSQFVRGCLRRMYEQGVDPHHAHMLCYAMADHQGFGRPTARLAWCFAKCFDYNPLE